MLRAPSVIEADELSQDEDGLGYSLPALAWAPSPQPRGFAKTARPPSRQRRKGGRPGARRYKGSPQQSRQQSPQTQSPSRAKTAPATKQTVWGNDDLIPWRPVSPSAKHFPQMGESTTSTSAFSFVFGGSGSGGTPSLLMDSLTEVVSHASPPSLGSSRNKPRRWLLSDAFLKKYMFAAGSPLVDDDLNANARRRSASRASVCATFSSPPSRQESRPSSRARQGAPARNAENRGSPVRSLCPATATDEVPSVEELRRNVQQEREAWLARRLQDAR